MMPAKRLWKRRLSARCKRFESFASVAFGEAFRVKPMRCTNLGATGAKRTCRRDRERADPTRMTEFGHRGG